MWWWNGFLMCLYRWALLRWHRGSSFSPSVWHSCSLSGLGKLLPKLQQQRAAEPAVLLVSRKQPLCFSLFSLSLYCVDDMLWPTEEKLLCLDWARAGQKLCRMDRKTPRKCHRLQHLEWRTPNAIFRHAATITAYQGLWSDQNCKVT